MDESTLQKPEAPLSSRPPLRMVSHCGHCALASQAPYPPPPAVDPSSPDVEKPVPPPKASWGELLPSIF